MSWLFSQALVAAYSAVNYSDGELCAPLNVMPTQQPFLRNDKMMEPCQLSQFGLTCEVLTVARGTELLMWYLAASPARTSASQEKALALLDQDQVYGSSSHVSLAKYSPHSHSLKTAQRSLLEDSTPSLVILPRWGLMHAGALYPLPTAVRHTSGNDSGLWATPTTMDKLPPKSAQALNKEATVTRPGRSKPANLRDQVSNMQNWPTPRAGDANGNGSAPKDTWKRKLTANYLRDVVQRYPTPTAQDAKNSTLPPSQAQRDSIVGVLVREETAGGVLNPPWVEWLMGWPIGWTDLRPLAMDKYQSWLQAHGEY